MWRLVLVLGLAACETDKAGGPPRGARIDAAIDADPYCHYDCFGELSCKGNVAADMDSVPVPCEYWEGSCPGRTHTCTSGCDLEFTHNPRAQDWGPRLFAFCAETPTAQEGDTCERLCMPTRAVPNGQGGVQQQYLTCDGLNNRCVAAPAPQVSGYLGMCGSAAQQYAQPSQTGVVRDGYERACLIAWDATNNMSRQAATITCVGDWECPTGASCDDSLGWLDSSLTSAAVCRPGPRGAPVLAHLP